MIPYNRRTTIGVDTEANKMLTILEGLFSKTPQKCFSLLEQLW
jgi:hypothetical protein